MDKPQKIPSSEITDERLYRTRRGIMRAGILAASTLATAWVYRRLNSPGEKKTALPPLLARATTGPATRAVDPAIAKAFVTDEKRTPFEDITHYNNFYEFSTDKDGVAPAAEGFIARPWQ